MYKLSDYSSFNKVLLIEDNLADARLVEILLEESELQCEVTNVTTLSDGIKVLKEERFAVILLDLTLPDSKGFYTIEELFSEVPDANVIILTGLASRDIGLKAVKYGAQDFLIKGDFDADELSKALRYSIERNSILTKLEEAQRISHIGNWELDEEDQRFLVSDEIYRIFGFTPKEVRLTVDLVRSMVHPDDFKIIDDFVDQLAQYKEAQQDIRIVREDGTTRHLSVLGKATKNKDEEAQYSGIIQDITERKKAALELIRSQQRYEAIFAQSQDAIYISTPEGDFVNFNPATSRLFGYSPKELKNIKVGHLFKNPEDFKTFTQRVIKTSFVKEYEVELLNKNGETRYCLVTASMLETGDLKGVNAIIRDITGRKQAEELRKAKEIAERSSAMKEKFIASVSHEMRTPMNAILGMSNLIQKDNLDDEQKSYINSIIQSSQHLLGIINDILEISTLEQEGKVQLKYDKIDLHALLKNLKSIYQYKTREKELDLQLIIGDDVEQFVVADQLRLNQILTNLTGNAIKFTEEGHVKIEVQKVKDDEKTTTIKFEIEDSGIGIPEDKLDDIFETFVRVRSSDGKFYPGTGLGLPIAKQLVEMQNGKVEVVSTVGVGSTFNVYITFNKVEEQLEEDQNQELEEEEITLEYTGEINLLLVEDHKLNQIVAKRTIEKEWSNVKISIANNGQESLDILAEKDFDIILMDVQMPVMDGIEATHKIRNEFPEDKAKTPILVMTAHAHMSQNEKYKEYGMDDCVLKPFQPKDLFSKIAYYVNQQKRGKMMEEHGTPNGQLQYIDLSYMDLMTDGEPEMKKMMLELLFDDPIKEIEKMFVLEKEKNWTDLKAVSHKMKSTLAFVGNDTLTKTNKRIELIAKEEAGFEELPELIDTLYDLFKKALIELKAEHARL